MSIAAKHYSRNAGTSSAKVLNANQSRGFLQIQNLHATQTARVKFGGAIVADVVEQQLITFSATPDAGAFKLTWNGNESGAIAFGDNAAAVQVALRALTGLASVTVAGSFAAGFTVTFTSATPNVDPDLPLLTVTTNSLTLAAVAVAVTVAETVKGLYADGFRIAAGAVVTITPAPIDDVYALASGADTRLEIIEG